MKKLALFALAGLLSPALAAQQFQPIPLDFEVVWDQSVHPFTGAAAIDIDGDGRDEVFIGGGLNQPDRLYRYAGGELLEVPDCGGLSADDAAHGALSIDIDGDGDVDLVLARAGGVYLYLNDGGGFFEERRIPVPSQPPQSEPFHVAVSDYDRDGDADLYLSYFVAFPQFKSATFNDPEHAKTNRLLRNDGDLNFSDVTDAAGVAGRANSFGALWLDLNGDGLDDLIIAQNTWQAEIFENNRDGTFTLRPVDTGYGFWMGIGVGDMDGDGDQDLFFPNAGSSIPRLLTRGDLQKGQRHSHEWALLRNDGDFQFADVTKEWGLAGEGFAWGGVFEDVNLDGRLDLFVAQNYIKWPPHKLFKLPGRAMLQEWKGQGGEPGAGGETGEGGEPGPGGETGEGGEPGQDERPQPVFRNAPELGLENKRFGQSSLFVDLDGDGRLDYFWINMGDKQAAYLNKGTGNFVSFRLPDDLAHLGTRIRIETAAGLSYARQFVAGQGFLTDQAPELVFGLGDQDAVERAIITWPDGTQSALNAPAINRRYKISRVSLPKAR